MSDFAAVRQQLRDSRSQRDIAANDVRAARDRLKRLVARQSQLERLFDPDNHEHVELRDALQRDRARLEAEQEKHRQDHEAFVATEHGLVDDFAVFSDPISGIERLDDSFPILMMPVRLETRFKKVVTVPGAPATDQLWVRVYPDDCWVDSFDPALTTSEFDDARTYWASIWQAGGVEDQERGAWRTLVNAHGSGRSAWIVRQYQPMNIAEKPAKAAADDVVLAIMLSAAVPGIEAASLSAFWVATWRSDGDATASATALAALEAAVGAARAEVLVATTVPANFAAALPVGVIKSDVQVQVAFLVLPDADQKQHAWARAPRADILPDRFVFIGYGTAGDQSPVVVVGRPVPSPLLVGPDPGAAEADQIQHDEDGNLVIPEAIHWMSDFDRAVEVGMGLVVDLNAIQASRGFERVLVLGLRLNADEAAAADELEQLLQHHSFRRTGMALVPQGTPTNNTDDVGSGRLFDDPDVSFDDLKAPQFEQTPDWLDKSDGQWLAEHLGIDPAVFANAHAAGGRDQASARAMNTVLWPATLGYWMETMMAPVFTPAASRATRDFFNQFVLAGGVCPSIRIGEQPYGILPTTATSRMTWFERRRGVDDRPTHLRELVSSPSVGYLRRLHPILLAIEQDLRSKLDEVAHVGAAGDPHQLLLDILGLHPGSVEWAQRYAESLKTLFNRLNLIGLGGFAMTLLAILERVAARQKLTDLGVGGEADPPILDLSFSGRHNALTGGVVDDQPLSETERVRAYTDSGDNYMAWLIDAANTSLDALYQQRGFRDDKRPTAILYLLLRHALQLGYSDVSIRLFEAAGIFTADQVLAARSDEPFLHIRDNQLDSESRYSPLFAASAAITGSPTQPIHEYIASNLDALTFSSYLSTQLQALERLRDRPTAQLERALADHVDCCAYRLDAWMLGIVNAQLALMRNLHEGSDAPPRRGVHLGAYAWLEPLRPEGKVLEPVRLGDDELVRAFGAGPALVSDATNQGYVHAPSLNHAVAAAVLRNGFISNASPANRRTMAVNLTSERVRTALAMIEGIRAGQSLSSLLGYQFERGLHDRHGMAEVDKFIYKLRKAFPIRADRISSTTTAEGVSIEAIEARNVIDGLALVEHMTATGELSYPFGKEDVLPNASVEERAAIDAEADRLRESHDAVADLALSEGVYQAVLGNYDRVASTYDAYARGNFPPEPDVVRTPLNGIGITHRVAIQLEPGVSATTSPVGGVAMTPRAQGEPGLNRWFADVVPGPDEVSCFASFLSAGSGAAAAEEVTLQRLGLQPSDLVAIIREDSEQAMSELDDRIVRWVRASFDPRPDVPIVIEYMRRGSSPYSVFEMMPLLRNIRRLTTTSRALRSSDLTLMNEATTTADNGSIIDKARLDLVRSSIDALRTDVAAFLPRMEGPLADLANRRDEILSEVDDYVDDLADLLARASTFVIAQAGWGFAYDAQGRTFAAILGHCAQLVERWDQRLDEFDARILEAQAAISSDEKFILLGHAEQAISTVPTSPLPATTTAYENDLLTLQRPAFVTKRNQFAAIAGTSRRRVSDVLDDVRSLLPVDPFDVVGFDLTAHEDEIIRFCQDVAGVVAGVLAEIDRRVAASQGLFDEHDASAAPQARLAALDKAAKVLLGEDFRVYPQFDLTPAQSAELHKAAAASAAGDLFDHLTNPPDPGRDPVDFPIDDWLYGVARVRDKLHAWEQTVMFAGALGRPEPELVPVQLPFITDDRWLALEFPPDLPLDVDRLLYTAHHAVGFDASAPQCGMLLDEWTETIPVQSIDTGITFHHDRPNCEAPQAMLLVTPTDFRGTWRWDDLIDALNETLDLAAQRAIEPVHLDDSPYAPFLPATVLATQVQQLTIALDLSFNNKIAFQGD